MTRFLRMAMLLVLALLAAAPLATRAGATPPAEPQATFKTFMPLIRGPQVCPSSSNRSYSQGPVYQRDGDNPVRPAWNHADKNIELRGYELTTGHNLGFIGSPSDDPQGPPQIAQLFNPARVPVFTNGYRIHNWNWAASPAPGTRGGLDSSWPITVMGMGTTRGESLRVPDSGYEIGQGKEVIVLFADANSILLKYTRDDSIVGGYALHVDNICTDVNLLSKYNQLDGPARNTFHGGYVGGTDYDLVTLSALEVFGTARGSEIRVAIVDQGTWMDLRYCADWWQLRPGRNCP
jgi:hypothetical protein